MIIVVCRTLVSIRFIFKLRYYCKPMPNNILLRFGQRVREERLRQKLSQEGFAEKAGVHRTYIGMIERAEKNITLINIEKIASALNISIADLLTFSSPTSENNNYIYNNLQVISVKNAQEDVSLEISFVKIALARANDKILLIKEAVTDLFAILGMRNLSAFIGEIFVGEMVKAANGFLVKNPHQDGYPDLLLMTPPGKILWESLKNNLRDKKPFSPFPLGGIEVKATCGSVPTPAQAQKKGLYKPGLGDARIDVLRSYDWKAHHRLTTNLLGLVWDFVDGAPLIVGLFYSAELNEQDWGKIIQPKAGGGRTTSVSIMTREGVAKMYQGWVAVLNDARYLRFFDAFNKASLIASRAAR